MTGTELIAKERERQIDVEGYDFKHDSTYTNNELFHAGCCYLAAERMRAINGEDCDPYTPPIGWPWPAEYWKPSPNDRTRELVKAGALFKASYDANGSQFCLDQMKTCVQEIDRLQRLEETK